MGCIQNWYCLLSLDREFGDHLIRKKLRSILSFESSYGGLLINLYFTVI